MGTPELAVPSLERLILDGHKVAAVFTQPDKPAGRGKHLHASPIKTFALERDIPVHQPARIKTNEEVRAIFETISPDVCVVVAYGKILPEWMLAIPRLGCINVHASLLPKYRGAAPINWAIANGERETGITIMRMDAGMDTGPMLAKRVIQTGDEEAAPELAARLAPLGADLLSETLARVERGEVKPEPQDDREATYAPMLKREDGLIDWKMRARQLANRVRAFQPWPGTYTTFRGNRLILWRAREEPDVTAQADDVTEQEDDVTFQGGTEAGTILAIVESGITMSCAGGTALRVEEVQVEGKRRVSAREFANGARLQPGDRII